MGRHAASPVQNRQFLVILTGAPPERSEGWDSTNVCARRQWVSLKSSVPLNRVAEP
jgi:hypothetical protein